MATAERLLVFDFSRRDWPRHNCQLIDGRAQLARTLDATARGPGRFSYRPATLDGREFGIWAKLALEWSQDGPVTIVAEELADVVHAGKAPGGWGQLVRGGLAYGNHIHGITQRVQETDKSIFGNATILRIFGTEHDGDRRYIAKNASVPVAKLAALKPLEYLEKNKIDGTLERKILTF